MSKTAIKEKAFKRADLIAQDITFKLKFYFSKNASYETAKIGSLKLIPSEDAIKELKADYEHMKGMIYGGKTSFEEIIAGLTALEKEINELPVS